MSGSSSLPRRLCDVAEILGAPCVVDIGERHVIPLGDVLSGEAFERLICGGLGVIVTDYDFIFRRDPRRVFHVGPLIHRSRAVRPLRRPTRAARRLTRAAEKAIFTSARDLGLAFSAYHMFTFH